MPDGYFHSETENGDIFRSPAAIVTAGGTPIKLGIPGELEYAGKGVSYCAICDAAFFKQQVEMGNVGLHYYVWRYGDNP